MKTRLLTRDIQAVQIPAGTPIAVAKGTEVQIHQVLGGNFTCVCYMGMIRVAWQDADALGEEVKPPPAVPPPAASTLGDASNPPDSTALWDALKSVFDPEIPVNIVDLGLVYSLDSVWDDAVKGHRVDMAMTLTAPGCGMGPVIAEDARTKLVAVPGVSHATVSLVWDPPWNQSMISEEGKMKLGLV